MKKQTTIKFIIFFGISLMFYLIGCVDTNVQPIPSKFDFRSQVKVVNVGYQGGADISLDGTTGGLVPFGTVAYGDESPTTLDFKDIAAGSKDLIIKYGSSVDTFKLVTDTDAKLRIFLMGNDTTKRVAQKSIERNIWQTKSSATDQNLYPVDSTFVAFMNGSPNASFDTLIVKGASIDSVAFIDTIAFSKSLGMADAAPYMKFAAGTDTLHFISSSDSLSSGSHTLISKEFTFSPQSRNTCVIYNTIDDLKIKLYQDD